MVTMLCVYFFLAYLCKIILHVIDELPVLPVNDAVSFTVSYVPTTCMYNILCNYISSIWKWGALPGKCCMLVLQTTIIVHILEL